MTGSVHTVLANYWCKALRKDKILAHQNSQRPGELFLKIVGKKIEIRGTARVIMAGEFML